MAATIYPTVPVQGQGAPPEAEPWPVDEHTVRVDEMFARRLDTEFASGVRDLLHHPETAGLTHVDPSVVLSGAKRSRRTIFRFDGPLKKRSFDCAAIQAAPLRTTGNSHMR